MKQGLLFLALLSGCGAKAPPAPVEPVPPLEHHRQLAEQPGRDQVLAQVRLASVALAHGEQGLAEEALRDAVLRMQDFRADGQFRAIVGAERAKEWKGEPYEKMMAFLYLGALLYQKGDASNALAMTKAAILADTGTRLDRYHSDFVPAWVLQALAYQDLGEPANARRSMEQAVDVQWARALTDHLTDLLGGVALEGGDSSGGQAARLLLLAGLPPALHAHPRDPARAIEGALSHATDLWRVALDSRQADWPGALAGIRRPALRSAFDHLEPLARGWLEALEGLPGDVVAELEDQERFLEGLLEDPGLLLWVEGGRGPRKVASGRYGQLLRILPRERGDRPRVALNGRPLRPRYLDSVTWQAQTRGGRRVDGFLKGKAVFKDSSLILGSVLIDAGSILRHHHEDSPVGTIMAVAGAVTWVAGALTSPTADTRQWELLPDTLWILRADPPPGEHLLTVDDRTYQVSIPDEGRVVAWLPRLSPGGPDAFGTPCVACVPRSRPERPAVPGPLAIPIGDP